MQSLNKGRHFTVAVNIVFPSSYFLIFAYGEKREF